MGSEPKHTHEHEHGHGHHHDHNNSHHHHHAHARDGSRRGLLIACCITFMMLILELIGFYYTNSLALISDAGHLVSDLLALLLSVFAGWVSLRPRNQKISFGWHRFEILAAGVNGGSLIVIGIIIIYEAIQRIFIPQQVDPYWLLPIAIVGLLGNLLSAWILHRNGDVEHELNLKSAYLHVLADALGSVGTIIAALSIMFWHITIVDPLVSLLIAVIISRSGYYVLKEALYVLMEAVPPHIQLADIETQFSKIHGVDDVHDLHVWSLTSDYLALTAHIIVVDDADTQHILQKAIHIAEEHFGIHHCTIQVETKTVQHAVLHGS